MENKKIQFVQRFKQLHREKTGKELSDVEALASWEKLISLVRAVYKPVPIDAFKKIINMNENDYEFHNSTN